VADTDTIVDSQNSQKETSCETRINTHPEATDIEEILFEVEEGIAFIDQAQFHTDDTDIHPV